MDIVGEGLKMLMCTFCPRWFKGSRQPESLGVRNKLLGQECVNLSQFVLNPGDRCYFIHQIWMSSLILSISVSAPVKQNE
jgi:hypothetical protein